MVAFSLAVTDYPGLFTGGSNGGPDDQPAQKQRLYGRAVPK